MNPDADATDDVPTAPDDAPDAPDDAKPAKPSKPRKPRDVTVLVIADFSPHWRGEVITVPANDERLEGWLRAKLVREVGRS